MGKRQTSIPPFPAKRPLLASPSPQRRFLLGAAIGTGMAAKAAEHGGADFLLALNAGRFRSMGAPSAACMLALRDSNRLVMDFGQSEILTQTGLPVFFGAAAFGLGSLEVLVRAVAAAGFHGVTNFPSCTFLDGRYRQFLEESGYGFDREIALLQAANAHGLATLAYAHSVEEACRVAPHVDIVNLDFGWNMGGSVGATSSLALDQACRVATEFVSRVRVISPLTHCLIEGGPIVTPEQMDQVCRAAKTDGYIGGSTIDRVPLESAIEMATGAFKTVGSLRKQVVSLERRLNRKISSDALMGFSESMESAQKQVAQAMEVDFPVLIVGEAGTGRREIAEAIHEARSGKGRWSSLAACNAGNDAETELLLFGSAGVAANGLEKPHPGLLELAAGSTLIFDEVGELGIEIQRLILRSVRAGGFWRKGDRERVIIDVRFVGLSTIDPAERRAHFDTKFIDWLNEIRIDLPALRDHLEDLPMLAESILRRFAKSEKKKLSPSGYRALLEHHWPGNLAELRTTLQLAASTALGGVITERDVRDQLKRGARSRSDRKSFASEREWIVDGLSRARYRRAETAQFLRISRKTLYNKMRQYGLLGTDKSSKAMERLPRITHRSRPIRG